MHRPRSNSTPKKPIAPVDAMQHELARHRAQVTALGDHLDRRSGKDRADEGTSQRSCGTLPSPMVPGPRGAKPRQNQLLAALPETDYARLRTVLEPVALPFGHVICEAGRPADHAYFPVAGIVSLTHELASGATAEVAITGRDGLVGVALLTGGECMTTRAVVRAAGYAYRLRADALADELDRSRALRHACLRYVQALLTQVTQTAACRGHHQVDQQMCRLLLATLDRLPGNEVALTHEMIAGLLGVRRESVTAAAGRLQAAGLIRCCRGQICVPDRQQIEPRACECYAAVKAESDRLVHGLPADPAPAVMLSRRAGSGAFGSARG